MVPKVRQAPAKLRLLDTLGPLLCGERFIGANEVAEMYSGC